MYYQRDGLVYVYGFNFSLLLLLLYILFCGLNPHIQLYIYISLITSLLAFTLSTNWISISNKIIMVPSCPNNCPQPILPLKYHLSASPTINLYNDHNFLAPYHHIFIITITFISLVNDIEARLEGAPPIISSLSPSSVCNAPRLLSQHI